jgi:hypothetical protein
MSASMKRTTAAAALIAASLYMPSANAQLGDLLNKGGGNGSASGLGSLGGLGGALSSGSLASGSIGNVAGVLEFCIKNNYLGGDNASSVKNSLMRKLPGGASSSDRGYSNGAKGILDSSDGKQFDLSGGGLKEQVTKQVCDRILAQGKSLL